MDVESSKIKMDCFGFCGHNEEPECRILTEMLCKNKACSFYKTWEQYEKDLGSYSSQYEGWMDCFLNKDGSQF